MSVNFDFDVAHSSCEDLSAFTAVSRHAQDKTETAGRRKQGITLSKGVDVAVGESEGVEPWFKEHHPLHEIQVRPDVHVHAPSPEKTSNFTAKAATMPRQEQQQLALQLLQTSSRPTGAKRVPAALSHKNTAAAAAALESPFYTAGDKSSLMHAKQAAAAAAEERFTSTSGRKRKSEVVEAEAEGKENKNSSTTTGVTDASRYTAGVDTVIKGGVGVMSTQPTTKRPRPSQVRVHIEPTRKPNVKSRIYTGSSSSSSGAGLSAGNSKAAAHVQGGSKQQQRTAAAAEEEEEEEEIDIDGGNDDADGSPSAPNAFSHEHAGWDSSSSSGAPQTRGAGAGVGVGVQSVHTVTSSIGKGKKSTVTVVTVRSAFANAATAASGKGKGTYVSQTHSVKDTRRWEKKTGQLWLELSAVEREAANLEIARMAAAAAAAAE